MVARECSVGEEVGWVSVHKGPTGGGRFPPLFPRRPTRSSRASVLATIKFYIHMHVGVNTQGVEPFFGENYV